jgi:hypothetical protein
MNLLFLKVMEKLKGSLFVQPQPLLARRKQIQMGHDSLQTGNVVNSTMQGIFFFWKYVFIDIM